MNECTTLNLASAEKTNGPTKEFSDPSVREQRANVMRKMRPVLLVVDSRCEALSNLKRNSKTREVDERKKSINNNISQLKFCCRFCATSR